jgi:hypothetical protein
MLAEVVAGNLTLFIRKHHATCKPSQVTCRQEQVSRYTNTVCGVSVSVSVSVSVCV